MKKLLYYLSLPAFFCPISSSIQAAECSGVIKGSCDITASKTAEGPLFTIEDGAEGVVNVNLAKGAGLDALYRGEVFRFEGKSSVLLNISSPLSSDADTIRFSEGAQAGKITFKDDGQAVSRHRHAIYVQAGSQYDIEVGKGTALKSSDLTFSAVRIANSATGQLTVEGSLTADKSHALLYANDPGHLWSEDRLPVGSNKLLLTSGGGLQSAPEKGHIAYGRLFHRAGSEPEAAQWNTASKYDSSVTFDVAPYSDLLVAVSDIPSDGTYLSEGNGFNFGAGSRIRVIGKPAFNKVYNLIKSSNLSGKPLLALDNPLATLEMSEGLSTKEISFKVVPQSSSAIRYELVNMGWSDQRADTAAMSMAYGPADLQAELYQHSDNQAALKTLTEQLTPDTPHSVEQTLSTGYQARSQISLRVASAGLQSSGVNAGDGSDRPAVWAELLGYKGKLESHGDDPGYDSDVKGVVAGADVVSEQLDGLLGFAFSYQQADTDYSHNSSTDTDSWLVAVYGERDLGTIGIESILSYSWTDNTSKRRFANKEDKADFKSNAFSFEALGYLPLTFQPLLGFNITHVKVDDYHYRQLNQKIKSISETVVEAGFGVRYFDNSSEGFSPRAKAMLWYNLSNSDLNTRYTIGDSPVIVVSRGRSPERLTLTGSIGFNYRVSATLLGCDLNGAYRDDYSETGFNCRVRYEF